MFRFFRKRSEAVKKYLLIFFLGIVSVGMVITLAPIPTGDSIRMETNALAEINGSTITTQDLRSEIETRFRGTPLSTNSGLVPAVARSVLDDMILRRALEAQARKLGIEVSEAELLSAIQRIPGLNSNGTFVGMDLYSDLIQRQTGLSVAQFEAQLRQRLLIEKLRAVLTDGLQVSREEVREEFLKRNAKAKIEYVLFDPSQLQKSVAVTPEKLAAAFAGDRERYKLPEHRRVRYVLIDADAVRSRANVGEEELRRAYTEHLADFRVPDRVKVTHILFKTAGKNPQEISAIEKTAQSVLAQVKPGADFGELAKKYSEDSTASNGGEIGWIVRGQTVKEFEEATFSLKPGQISGLIKTIYGIHILKVLDKQTAHLQSFDEVKETLRDALEKQTREAAEQALATKIAGELKASPQAFGVVAKNAGLEVKETPLFRYNQTVPDFGSSESFFNLAFELREGEVGPPLAVPKGLAIIQVAQIAPEHVPSLEEVRARVEEDYRARQSKVLAQEKAKQFAAECKSGDFRQIARKLALEVKESKDFNQQDEVEDVGSGSQLAAAFTLNPGQASDVVQLGEKSIVFRVVSHTPANEADLAGQQDQIREELLERKRTLAFEIFRQNLKQELVRGKALRINETGLKQFLSSYERPG